MKRWLSSSINLGRSSVFKISSRTSELMSNMFPIFPINWVSCKPCTEIQVTWSSERYSVILSMDFNSPSLTYLALYWVTRIQLFSIFCWPMKISEPGAAPLDLCLSFKKRAIVMNCKFMIWYWPVSDNGEILHQLKSKIQK